MKRSSMLLFTSGLLAAVLTACGPQAPTQTQDTPGQTTQDTTTQDIQTPQDAGNTAETLLAYFQQQVKDNPTASAEEIATLYRQHPYLADMALDIYSETYLPDGDMYISGVAADAALPAFESVTHIQPMISPNTFISHIFQLSEGTDVEAFCAQLRDNADPSWNICVTASECAVGYEGNLAFLVMCDDMSGQAQAPQVEDTVESVLSNVMQQAGLDRIVSPFALSSSLGASYSGIEDNIALLEDDAAICLPEQDESSVRVMKLLDAAGADAVIAEMQSKLAPTPGNTLTVTAQGGYVLGVIGTEAFCTEVAQAFETVMAENF